MLWFLKRGMPPNHPRSIILSAVLYCNRPLNIWVPNFKKPPYTWYIQIVLFVNLSPMINQLHQRIHSPIGPMWSNSWKTTIYLRLAMELHVVRPLVAKLAPRRWMNVCRPVPCRMRNRWSSGGSSHELGRQGIYKHRPNLGIYSWSILTHLQATKMLQLTHMSHQDAKKRSVLPFIWVNIDPRMF